MSITRQHTQEQLSRAFIVAVAGMAGVNLANVREHDYGIDGTFRQVTIIPCADGSQERQESGFAVDFQLKATINCIPDADAFKYTCSRKAYDKLLRQNTRNGTISCLLLVLCMPRESENWLTVNEEGFTMHARCYWYYLNAETPTMELQLPRTQLFTPAALQDILRRVEDQEGKL